jgi:hypothetical protein
MTQDPEPLSARRPGVDPAFEAIIMKALEREREQRFGSAKEMRERLEEYRGERSTATMSVTAPIELAPMDAAADSGPTMVDPEGPARQKRSNRRPALLAVVLVVALIGAGFLLRGLLTGQNGGETVDEPMVSSSPGVLATPAAEPEPAPTEPQATPTEIAAPVAHEAPPTRPPATPTPETAMLPGRPVTLPRIVSQPPADLPGDAVQTCAGTSVSVSLQIGANGEITRSRVLSQDSPEPCRAAALAAVQSYEFAPAEDAQRNPVPASMAISVTLQEVVDEN